MHEISLDEQHEFMRIQRAELETRHLSKAFIEGLDARGLTDLMELTDPQTGDGGLLAQIRFMRIRALQQSGGTAGQPLLK